MNDNLISLREALLKSQWYSGCLMFVWIFLVYTEIPVSVGGGKTMPSIFLVLLLPLVWPTINKNLKAKHIFFVLSVTVIATLTIVVKLNISLFQQSVIKILQLAYSVCICVFTYLLLIGTDVNVSKRVLLAFVLFIIIGCILERVGLIRSITENYRIVYAATSGGGEIDQDREFSLAGFLRPYLFTAEPSIVGFSYFSVASAYIIVNNNKKVDVLLLMSIFIMLFLLGSPTIILCLPMFLLAVTKKYNLSLPIFFLSLFLIIAASFVLSKVGPVGYVIQQIVGRVAEEVVSERSSIYGRIYVPYMLTFPKVITAYPYFGVGLSNFGAINELFGYNANYREQDSLYIEGANGFINMLVYFGIIGTLMLFLSIYYFHRSNRIPFYSLTCLFIVLFGQMSAAVSTPRYWAYIGIFMAAIKLRKKLYYSNALGQNQIHL